MGEFELSEPDTEKDIGIIVSKTSPGLPTEQRVSKPVGALFQIKRSLSKLSSLSLRLNAYCGYIYQLYHMNLMYGSQAKQNQEALKM